ncbi:DNA-binding transcriptional regulator, MocR family, contains an aminotransferase domain [Gracilibacillus orientalis]|uniref:DNA-binding transcriptional regulator, MocR family, contains an aminotransferase domain n=1 Tax=Gracilibacillus orientalis TaxID=334253 RepID=A0A1I4ISM7_9BACI|nr:PLP-dependent aminotransferase family protein [Gracilibacillus orientalis]SFL56766.1 DNA-binding transcriptional regulator, MocR family, contains an aminotransferase domain [Gracilibacillus orientalis]
MNTKYSVIMNDIKQKIFEGTLKSGSKISSIRYLSEKYSCSKNTIIKAYNELEKQHLIYSIPKSGYYVVHDVNPLNNMEDSPKIDFLSAGPDNAAMPYKDFQHCINQAIGLYKGELFTYSHQQGLMALRKELTKHLQDRQVFTSPERMFILSGSQQAINLLTPMSFPNGKSNILIEQPTYFGAVEAVQLHNVKTFGIELSMEGIDLDRLEYMFRHNEIKFFYIIPRFHNPLGHSYSNEEKREIVELANKYDVYIVEDDIFGDLDINSKSDPMFTYDPRGKVIYIKSFSKIMLPGLRIGIAVLPELLINTFSRHKFSNDLFSTTISQGALEIYLKSGMFNSHLENIRDLYRTKMEIVKAACQHYLSPNYPFTAPETGFYMSIYLPRELPAKRLVNALQQENVFVDDAKRMYLPEFQKENLIRVCIAQVDKNQIYKGVETIAKYIHTLKNQQVEFY